MFHVPKYAYIVYAMEPYYNKSCECLAIFVCFKATIPGVIIRTIPIPPPLPPSLILRNGSSLQPRHWHQISLSLSMHLVFVLSFIAFS